LTEQARLPALGYRSIVEQLAEKFHAAPALLERLNRGARFEAGSTIRVPDVTAFEWDAPKPTADPTLADVRVEVSREESSLRVLRPDGSVVFFAPVTTGSEHDPLPPGNWKVVATHWKPVFHYNPDLFWDAKPTDNRARIRPGPNNPVGIVWIDLNLEHYGIHGTPEPERVGHTASHGCVRLTNWDAARVAALVTAGTPVLFR
jgi:lipoprotein-anchoring transpeptidase ErfK/SrfK